MRDLLSLRLNARAKEGIQALCLKPGLHLLAKFVEIQPPRAVIAREMDHVPDPLYVDRGVFAVVLEQRYRDAGNRRRLHVGKGSFQNGQAAHAHDRFDLARSNT